MPSTSPAPCRVTREGTVIRLEDVTRGVSLAVSPRAGNMAFSLQCHGHELLRFPHASIDAYLQSGGGLEGIPLLAPWANRLDEMAFHANGHRYTLDGELGNVRPPQAIHGCLSEAAWEVCDLGTSDTAAWVTSRLEVYRDPGVMRQFPFAHVIEMTYRLEQGAVEVRTHLENLCTDPMPVSLGFHPFFVLDAPRAAWTLALGARSEWVLDAHQLPTGERRPLETRFPDRTAIGLADVELDDVFGDLDRDAMGRSTTSIRAGDRQIDVVLGPGYRALVVYAPRARTAGAREFICIEPMAAITNALNLAHRGLYGELHSIPPGGSWQESFWIRPGGFS